MTAGAVMQNVPDGITPEQYIRIMALLSAITRSAIDGTLTDAMVIRKAEMYREYIEEGPRRDR
jgi:hypothetical protein